MRPGSKQEKDEKRAAALRENLKRRKAASSEIEERQEMFQQMAGDTMDNPADFNAAPGLLSDAQIRRLATEHGMISPFVEKQSHDGVISYGLSSYGYDARCSNEFKIFTNVDNAIVDPKNFSAQSFVDRNTDVCIIPPNSFALTRSVEYFKIPDDVLVICLGKSTYARCGLIVNVTPLEPGWEGHVTLEISNTTPLPAKVYANEGVAQFLFFKGSDACEITYAMRAGKYMGQTGVTLPKMKENI